MKKIISLVLVVVMCLSMALMFTGCGKEAMNETDFYNTYCVTYDFSGATGKYIKIYAKNIDDMNTQVWVYGKCKYIFDSSRFTSAQLDTIASMKGEYIYITVGSVSAPVLSGGYYFVYPSGVKF